MNVAEVDVCRGMGLLRRERGSAGSDNNIKSDYGIISSGKTGYQHRVDGRDRRWETRRERVGD
jgi:hypothetical protein